ncbi:phage tail protein [Sphingomonas sp. R1]|uniref:phage tail protein n=1 Tax=Sphingomonas sp. R1 TaxID=399176 RepID=UPI002224ACF4|nr:phage tail protein [Sphingomonas sp. R1]UYY79216.1 phage tail protein [Sphingomonas sp. R1]
MNKPDSLRCVLLAHVPQLRDDPSKLSLFVDKGRVAARPGSLAFEYRYTLNLVVQDYAGSIDGLMVPILAWISEAQPDLLQANPQEPFRFESELLSAEAADVSVWIELSEIVIVQPLETGGFTTSHPEQAPLADAFDGVGCVSLLQLLLRDVPADDTRLVAEHVG